MSRPEGGGGGERIQVFASTARARTIDSSDPRLPPQIFLSLDGMAFWPADSRENVPVASKKKVKQARWEYPFVTEGSLTATTLVNKDGKFEWTHVLQDKGQFVSTVDKLTNENFVKGCECNLRGRTPRYSLSQEAPTRGRGRGHQQKIRKRV